MPAERIQPQGLSSSPVYAQVVKAGNTVYIAGQTAVDEQGNVVGRGDIRAQTAQVFENLKRALTSVGADFGNLVKVTIYLTDPRYRAALTEVRGQYVKGPLPVSTLLVVAGLADPDYLLEIDAVAVVD